MKWTSLFACLFLFAACQPAEPTIGPIVVNGETMGTTFRVVYLAKADQNYSNEMDSLLKEVNDELSTYIPSSRISRFNQADNNVILATTGTRHFERVFRSAKEIYKTTDSYLDPTVMPLINYWGFGYDEKRMVTEVDSLKVDSLRQYIGFEKVEITPVLDTVIDGDESTRRIVKSNPSSQLDFSSLAKGYGVDAIGELLESKGIKDYMVEIGGEVRARGKNGRGAVWTFGVSTPKAEAEVTDINNVIALSNLSSATSGNYRNFYEKDGKKYAHIINPFSGFPQPSTLLSATVFADDCMTADAYATAFMVMGKDKAKVLVNQIEGIEALFIFSDEAGNMQTEMTDGAKNFVLQ
ncbi:MAG: FAD:protein FMN transferase [Bacteroidota bacterium]